MNQSSPCHSKVVDDGNDCDGLDVSSFPLIRIDQVFKFPSSSLEQCEAQLVPLVAQLNDNQNNSEGNIQDGSLLSYSQRLLGVVRNELCSRSSSDGDPVDDGMSSHQHQSKQSSKRQSFVRVPLPSEISSPSSLTYCSSAGECDHTSEEAAFESKKSRKNTETKQSPRAPHFSRRSSLSSSDRRQHHSSNGNPSSNTNGGGIRGRTKAALASLKKKSIESIAANACQRRKKERLARKARAHERVRVLSMKKKAREERSMKAVQRQQRREERMRVAVDAMERVVEEATAKASFEGKSTEEAAIDGAAAVAAVVEANHEVFSESDTSESSLSFADDNESFSGSVDDPSSVSEKQRDEEEPSLSYFEHVETAVSACNVNENVSVHKANLSNEAMRLEALNTEESAHESSDNFFEMQETSVRGDENVKCIDRLHDRRNVKENNGQCLSSSDHDSSSEATYQSLTSTNEKCSTADSGESNYCQGNHSPCSEKLSSTATPAAKIDKLRKPLQTPRISAVKAYRDYFQHYFFAERYPTLFHIFTAFQLAEKASSTEETPKRRVRNNTPKEYMSCMKIQARLLKTIFQIAEELALNGCDDNIAVRESCNPPIKNFAITRFFRVQSSRPEVASIIYDAADALNKAEPCWHELPTDAGFGTCWNLLWSWSRPKIDYSSLLTFQKVNHFQDSRSLTRKDCLRKSIERYCSEVGGLGFSYNLQRDAHGYACEVDKQSLLGSGIFNIMPQTFILPKEYTRFVAAFFASQREDSVSNFWIMKPVRLSRGRGISLVNDVCAVKYSEPVVLQKYLMNPLLLYGFKFDLRLYLLVTSFNPLEAFMYREGFARFGSKKYSGSPLDISDERIHLTNSSVQSKYNVGNDHPAHLAGEDGGGNKVTLTWLWKMLSELGYDSTKMKRDVDELCLKTLLCAEDGIPYQPNAFEIFGFDVIFDENCRPWLIEVNSSPALSREHDLDFRIKGNLIRDTLTIVDPPRIDRDELLYACERRLRRNSWRRQMKTNITHREGDEWKHVDYRKLTEQERVDYDLRCILMNILPRQYGELPCKEKRGMYDRLAPQTHLYEKLCRIMGKNSTKG